MDLLKDLCKLNADILGEAHNEMLSQIEKVQIILDYEYDQLKQLELDGQKLWPRLLSEYPMVIYSFMSIWEMFLDFTILKDSWTGWFVRV